MNWGQEIDVFCPDNSRCPFGFRSSPVLIPCHGQFCFALMTAAIAKRHCSKPKYIVCSIHVAPIRSTGVLTQQNHQRSAHVEWDKEGMKDLLVKWTACGWKSPVSLYVDKFTEQWDITEIFYFKLTVTVPLPMARTESVDGRHTNMIKVFYFFILFCASIMFGFVFFFGFFGICASCMQMKGF